MMHYKHQWDQVHPLDEFTSDKVVVTKDELLTILEKYEYFNTRA
jgi:hypothetical protein